jgi:hypothetical protein
MELAVYVSNADDLLHLEQGLQNIDSFEIPPYILACILGEDPSAQEYVGNLVATEWFENYQAAGHAVSRLYFGQEFCEYLIPSCDDMSRALTFARSSGWQLTYVTGYVTDAGLAATRRNVEWLARHDPTCEIVVNDWGVLDLIAGQFPAITPVLGRLLIKQQRMARYTNKTPPINMRGINSVHSAVLAEQIAALRQLNLSIPEYRARLTRLGVRRFDLDIVPQGVELPKDAWGFGVSCYYPWGYVTGGRNCYTAGMLDSRRSYVVMGSSCPAPCRGMNRSAKVVTFPQPPVQRGNSVFVYHTQYAVPYWNGEIPVDRIVFEPWIPW